MKLNLNEFDAHKVKSIADRYFGKVGIGEGKLSKLQALNRATVEVSSIPSIQHIPYVDMRGHIQAIGEDFFHVKK